MSLRPEIPARLISTQNGRDITLREGIPEDAQMMLDYLNYIGGESDFLTFGAGEFGRTLEFEQDYLQTQRTSKTGLMIVAHDVERGEIVGCMSFSTGARDRMQHSGDLGVSVAKACWGEGVGRALMEMLIDWTSRHDIVRKLNLFVRTDNVRAIALYMKLGFEIEGTLRAVMYHDECYFDDYAMGLWVDYGCERSTLTK